MNFLMLLLFALASSIQLGQAAEPPADATARATLHALIPKAKIDKVEAAPLPGYRQVLVGGQMIYVSDDGKYLLQGTLYDARTNRNLTSERMAVVARQKLDAVPRDERIIFAPSGKPKYTVTVFTDLDCGYCRKLHSQIAEYNKRGIAFDYLFFPRTGLGGASYNKAVSVWCAKDRKAAFTAAKEGHNPAPMKCPNPVAEEFNLGREVGVDGTPTIFAANGVKLGGYLPPDEMLKKLQSLGTPTFATSN